MTLQEQLEQAESDWHQVEAVWHKVKTDFLQAHPDMNKSGEAFAKHRRAYDNLWHEVDVEWHKAHAKIERIKALIAREMQGVAI